jgi:hypothetical protein
MGVLTTVIPVYNGEPFLAATLQCLVEQERHPDRVVVIDNRSTDNTFQIVHQFSGKLPCEWRQNETNIGSAGNLNRALGLSAETDYLHILPADDLIKPSFYRKLLAELEQCKGRALAYTHYELIDPRGRPLSMTKTESNAQTRHIRLKEFLRRQSELQSVMCPAVVHKTVRQPTPAYFKTDFPQVADCVFYSEWAQACQDLVEIPDILCQNRHHPFSATSANIRSVEASVLDEWHAMCLIVELIPENPVRHWLRKQKLKCLYAARTKVKIQLMRRLNISTATEADAVLRQLLSPIHIALGAASVTLRDLTRKTRGQPSKAEELFSIFSHAKSST